MCEVSSGDNVRHRNPVSAPDLEDDLGNCSCKREKGRWVALRPPPGSHRPATPVDQGVAAFEGMEIVGGLLLLPVLK